MHFGSTVNGSTEIVLSTQKRFEYSRLAELEREAHLRFK